MEPTRRKFLGSFAGIAAVPVAVVSTPTRARACLYGKWNVQCPRCGRVDRVDDGTCQHRCERCDTQVFSENKVTVVCRNGHPTQITSGACSSSSCTTSYLCPKCGTDCRLG